MPPVHILDLHFVSDQVIAAFVIESDEGPVVIETGPHSTFTHLDAGLQRLGYKVGDVKHVLLTHIHFDHAGAAWALAQEGATVYVHPIGHKHLKDPSRLYNSAKMIYKDQMETLWGRMEAIPEAQLIAVEDNTQLHIGQHTFTGWHTPGHARHHIAWQLENALFAGDVAGCKIGQGPLVPPCPPPDIDIEAWTDSIELMRSLKLDAIYITHYGHISEVPTHLDQLEAVLWDWANWIKGKMDAGIAVPEMIPLFQAYTDEKLGEAGLDSQQLVQYNAANPAWMSVAGLVRYWTQKANS